MQEVDGGGWEGRDWSYRSEVGEARSSRGSDYKSMANGRIRLHNTLLS